MNAPQIIRGASAIPLGLGVLCFIRHRLLGDQLPCSHPSMQIGPPERGFGAAMTHTTAGRLKQDSSFLTVPKGKTQGQGIGWGLVCPEASLFGFSPFSWGHQLGVRG